MPHSVEIVKYLTEISTILFYGINLDFMSRH